jgi:hypothetical protein
MRRFAMLPLAGLLLSGALKAAQLFEVSPVDITAGFAGLVLLQCAVVLVASEFRVPRITGWAIGAYTLLLPAALWSPSAGDLKIVDLFTVAALSTLSPLLLVRQRRHLVGLLVWMAILATLASADALLTAGQTVARVGELRLAFGDAGNPIQLGRLAGCALVVAAVAAFRRDVPWFLLVPVSLLLVAVLLRTASQGPALAAGAAVAISIVASVMRERRVLAAVVTALVAVGVIVVGLNATTEEQRERLITFGHNEETRLAMWTDGMRLAVGHPHGIGWGAFESRTDHGHVYPHNVWIETLVEGGWVPGAVLGFVTIVAFRRAWRSSADAPAGLYVLAMLTFWTVGAAFTGSLPANRPMLGMLTVAALTPTVLWSGRDEGVDGVEGVLPRATTGGVRSSVQL